MYLEHWGFKYFPFDSVPSPDFFYESEGHKEAIARLIYSVQTKKPLVLIIGDYGNGKTVLCKRLLRELSDSYKTAFITNPLMDALDIIREIVYQMGNELVPRDKVEVLHVLNSILERNYASNRHNVVIIDEAHLIKDSVVFEELRLLLNHHIGNSFLITLILTGQVELYDRIRNIPQLVQRVSLKYYLPCLKVEEIREYINHRIAVAGGSESIFPDEVVDEIARISKGNPREINAICELALLSAYSAGRKKVELEDIQEAFKEKGS